MPSRSAWRSDISRRFATPFDARVSSANDERKELWSSASISPIRIRNNSGPITDPCGTPERTCDGSELKPLAITHWLRFSKNDSIHLRIFPPIPRSESFSITIRWSTLSNALENSRYKQYQHLVLAPLVRLCCRSGQGVD